MEVIDRFLNYISIDTQSKEDQDQVPSTDQQRKLAECLAEELRGMGAQGVLVSEHGYVYAEIPATTDKSTPVIGFIAHMDTSPAYPGTPVHPQIIRGYDGTDILLNQKTGLMMKPEDFPDLLRYRGQDIITTDGTSLLGADDKAGIAEIMSMAAYFLSHPEISHGRIKLGFTPDEEVGRGADFFDVAGFGADAAYTVDGGALGELEYENFNAASVKIQIHGISIHPGSSKGKMKNAILIGMELQAMLPVFENPMYTEGYEGFYHLNDIQGGIELAFLNYIIRDHSRIKFEEKKAYMQHTANYLNQKYGVGTIVLEIKDSYYNMKEMIEPHMELIVIAKESMKELGIQPLICTIRGGTDGARLSYMGLPCPNLCTGGHNFHGKFEFISIQSMEQTVLLLITIAIKFAIIKK